MLGGNSNGLSFSLVGGSVNTAIATSNATNKARTYGAGFGTADNSVGTITLDAQSTSYASADIIEQNSIGFYAFDLTLVYAYAEGTFDATADNGGKAVYAADIDIDNCYTAKACAFTGAATATADIGLFSAGANVALATVKPTVTGGISGNGEVTITGSGKVNINVTGTGKAYATLQDAHGEPFRHCHCGELCIPCAGRLSGSLYQRCRRSLGQRCGDVFLFQ